MINKFMYELVEENCVKVFQLNKKLNEKKHIVTLGEGKMMIATFLPNMYYPAVEPSAPNEVKAVYKYLKDTYSNKFRYVELYNKNMKTVAAFTLVLGR